MDIRSRSNNAVWLVCLALVLIKLWLTASQRIHAIGGSLADDFLFVLQASHMLRGEWLGPYDHLTLVKGPFLSAWIASAFALGIPVLVSVQLLYAAACGVMTLALRPFLIRGWSKVLFFAVLLFNPESYTTALTRLLREMITPALVLFVAACAVGVLLSSVTRSRGSYGWAVGLGVAFAALWLTREEQLVVVPGLVFVLGCSVVLAWRRHVPGALGHGLRAWLTALGAWGIIVLAVYTANYHYYGLFNKTEVDDPSYNAAYGALSRVKPVEFKPMVAISKKTLRLIYHVSPAAAELKPYLEGRIGALWETITEPQQDAESANDIIGVWFQWAFRDAVVAAGYYDSGRYPAEYYQRLANEVNSACEKGLLECYGPRRTMLPVLHKYHFRRWIPSFVTKLGEVVGFEAVPLGPSRSTGTREDLALYRALAGPITSDQIHHIELEVAASGPGTEIKVRDWNGTPVRQDTRWAPSRDLDLRLAGSDDKAGGARYAHYSLCSLDLACTEECVLEIASSGQVRASIRFADLIPTKGMVEGQGIRYRVIAHVPPTDPLPEEVRLSELRTAALSKILWAYRLLNPIAVLIALASYAWLTFRMIRGVQEPGRWIALTSFAILSLSRVALIALMNVTSLKIPPGSYLFDAYPTMLAFVGLACISGVERLSGLKARLQIRRR